MKTLATFTILAFAVPVVYQLRPADNPEMMKVAIFIYDGVELLDFSGPAQVFAVANKKDSRGEIMRAFKVYTVGQSREVVKSQGFLQIIPDYTFADAPVPDIIVFPGGNTSPLRKVPALTAWIKARAVDAAIVMSVCNGAFFLGDAGLLENKSATTWYGLVDKLGEQYPTTKVLKNTRYVDNGSVITTAGISAGIDGALHIVERLIGEDEAKSVATYMEYDQWVPRNGVVIH